MQPEKTVTGMPASQSRAADAGVEAAVAAVIAAGRWAAGRNWVPATSGNFSARIDSGRIAITRSGPDKGALEADDVLLVALKAPPANASAEAPLHYALYRDDPAIGAILHLHSPAATVLSRRAESRGFVRLSGWELQKALAGVRSHLEEITVPVVANDQDTENLALAAQKARAALAGLLAPAYLIAGHGLYVWGAGPGAAMRHAEALETLFHYHLSY